MRYVSKPVMVEAQLFDCLQSAMDWLEPGEFTIIGKDSIWLLDQNKKPFNIPFDGRWYVLRVEDGLLAQSREDFEKMFVSMDDVEIVDFSAEGTEEEGYIMSCTVCGPIGHCSSRDDFPLVAEEHMAEHHLNHPSVEDECDDCDEEGTA